MDEEISAKVIDFLDRNDSKMTNMAQHRSHAFRAVGLIVTGEVGARGLFGP